MSESKPPEDFLPKLPESKLEKQMKKLQELGSVNWEVPMINHDQVSREEDARIHEKVSLVQEIAAERHRHEAAKEADEEAYREETIRALRAIESNTANLYVLVDLISKNGKQQDELIGIFSEILAIAKAKNQEEADSLYKKVMGKITQTVNDVETLAKFVGYATMVFELVKPIIDNIK